MIKCTRSGLAATILAFLIIKVSLAGIFLHAKRAGLVASLFDSTPALAEDADAGADGKKTPEPLKDDPSSASAGSSSTQLPGAVGAVKNVGDNLETLERKRSEIETEREMLEMERQKLAAIKQEIETKLVKLAEIREELQRKLDEQKAIQDARTKHLIKIYTTMPPKRAAALIEKLDMKVILELFSGMKGEQVGAILPHVSEEKAAKISELLANRQG